MIQQGTEINCHSHLVKLELNKDTEMNPLTPNTDQNWNSPHSINILTNMSMRIKENKNWKDNLHLEMGWNNEFSELSIKETYSHQLGEFFF